MRDAYAKNSNYKYDPILPKPDVIYEKEFHFIDETILKMEQTREEKRLERRRERERLDNKEKEIDATEAQDNVRNVIEKPDAPEAKADESASKALDLKEQNYSDEKE